MDFFFFKKQNRRTKVNGILPKVRLEGPGLSVRVDDSRNCNFSQKKKKREKNNLFSGVGYIT